MSVSIKVAMIVFNPFINDSRVLKEAQTLARGGFDVTVFAHGLDTLAQEEMLEGFWVRRVSSLDRSKATRLQKIGAYAAYVWQCALEARKYPILHCNDLNTLPIGFIVKKLFNNKVKIVYDAHEFEINDKPNQSRLSIKLHYYLERFLIRYADAVITVSDSIANEYARLYHIPKPALVLNTPPYTSIEKQNIFRSTLGIAPDQTIFLYQGGLSRGRGIEILLEAFRTITNPKAVIVFMGYGPLESLVQEYALTCKQIFFHHAVAPEVLLDFTCSADYGILFYENNCLNHEYCSPNKMFEYVMAEIPVIVSDLFEMKRLVQHYGIGTVAPSNTLQGLQKAIEAALGLDKALLHHNLLHVKQRYHWEAQEKVLLEVYQGLTP